MKKILILLVCMVAFVSCHKHKTFTVENAIEVDNKNMFANYSEYKWFETTVVLKEFLDENCSGTIEEITNIFQAIESEDDRSFDTKVITFKHTTKDIVKDIVEGFWVEDSPLYQKDIKLTFKQAFEKVNQVNYPKPHSRYCVLRKEVGPVDANPQYIFGNSRAQLYVDAITGKVTDKNPVYPNEFVKPLGEWP